MFNETEFYKLTNDEMQWLKPNVPRQFSELFYTTKTTQDTMTDFKK